MIRLHLCLLILVALGCGQQCDMALESQAAVALDSLHLRMSALHRERDPVAYAELHSDSVVFEWPTLAPVRGRSELAALMLDNWRTRDSLRLDLTLVARRVAGVTATEVLGYRESWTAPAGQRVEEHGRFMLWLSRASDGRWYVDRFFGFSDSTTSLPPTD